MSPISLTAAALPWLVVAWVITVVVVALLIYLIVRAVLGKTEPQRLPEVLQALGPLVKGVAQALARPLMPPTDGRGPIPPTNWERDADSRNIRLLDLSADRKPPPDTVARQVEDPGIPIKEIP